MPNATHLRPETEADRGRYARLPPGPKMVLQIKSLVFLPTTKSVFADIFSRSGLKTPEGRAWSSQSINAALELLGREQLLTDDLTCVPSLLHPVAIDAVAAPDGGQMVAAIRYALAPSSSYFYVSTMLSDPTQMIRLARLAIYANDTRPSLVIICTCDSIPSMTMDDFEIVGKLKCTTNQSIP